MCGGGGGRSNIENQSLAQIQPYSNINMAGQHVKPWAGGGVAGAAWHAGPKMHGGHHCHGNGVGQRSQFEELKAKIAHCATLPVAEKSSSHKKINKTVEQATLHVEGKAELLESLKQSPEYEESFLIQILHS